MGWPRRGCKRSNVPCEAAVQHLTEARTAIDRITVGVPNLKSGRPNVVAQYQPARNILVAGHGGKRPVGDTLAAD